MSAIYKVDKTSNEPIMSYAQGSHEREAIREELNSLKSETAEIPLIVGGKEIRTGNMGECRIPHNHKHIPGIYRKAGKKEVDMAIEAALEARKKRSALELQYRLIKETFVSPIDYRYPFMG